jgi:hypothetical protein
MTTGNANLDRLLIENRTNRYILRDIIEYWMYRENN